MSLKSRNNPANTLVFRLTVWHAIVFILSLAVIFFSSYTTLTTNLLKRVDNFLLIETADIEREYFEEGYEELREEVFEESQEEGVGRVVIRLLSPGIKELATSELNVWSHLDFEDLDRNAGAAFKQGIVFHTLRSSKAPHEMRFISRSIVNGNYVIQFGITLEDNQHLIDRYRRTFLGTLLGMLLIGTLLGWLVSKKAMSGVERITQTATRIGKEGFNYRVKMENEGREIEELADAFNHMLDRIETLIREISDVTDNLAHDLRTPITRIRGFAETTLNGEQNIETYKEGYRIVVEECDRLVKLINTMLEIKQADAGIKDFHTTRLDIVELVRKGYEVFLPLAEDKRLDFRFEHPDSPMYIQGDEPKLQRVVSNLLDNAIKFTGPQGKILLRVSEGDREGWISIKDTGIGIPAEQISRIFEKFYRVDTSRSTTGNGLGLSWVKSIVTSLGWSIHVSSSPGAGSEFIIKIPLDSPAA
ncbi:MAG: sensor histidine kinase [Candidatus Omnitrophota bacterium]